MVAPGAWGGPGVLSTWAPLWLMVVVGGFRSLVLAAPVLVAEKLCPDPFPRSRVWGNVAKLGCGRRPAAGGAVYASVGRFWPGWLSSVASSAGRFWPARLSCVRLGGGEWRAGLVWAGATRPPGFVLGTRGCPLSHPLGRLRCGRGWAGLGAPWRAGVQGEFLGNSLVCLVTFLRTLVTSLLVTLVCHS